MNEVNQLVKISNDEKVYKILKKPMGEFNIMNCIVMDPSIKFRFFGSCSSESILFITS